MVRRSIGSRSAAKQIDQMSFLDKAAAASNKIEAGSFEVRNPLNGVGALSSTATAKVQAAKLA